MSRWRESQLQVSENYEDLTKWRSNIIKSCWLMPRFKKLVGLNVLTKYGFFLYSLPVDKGLIPRPGLFFSTFELKWLHNYQYFVYILLWSMKTSVNCQNAASLTQGNKKTVLVKMILILYILHLTDNAILFRIVYKTTLNTNHRL